MSSLPATAAGASPAIPSSAMASPATRDDPVVTAHAPDHLTQAPASLDAQRAAYAGQRFLAMPLAGTVGWLAVALVGATDASPTAKVWALYLATGAIFYLGGGLSYLTGERFMDKAKRDNPFSKLFHATIMMSLLVFAIAIPFAQADWTSLPLSVGVLAGLMWLPLSWVLQHWVGWFHAFARTVLVLAAWYAWPEQRFLAVPLVIVGVYVVSIVALERRYRARARSATAETAATN